MAETYWLDLARAEQAQIVRFAQRMIQEPSLSGQEGRVADLITAELHAYGVGQIWRDAAGNVLARLGQGSGPSMMLNAHMDIVDPGKAADWRFDPYGGQIAEGCIWGRGAVDDKGCLAAQASAVGLLCREGLVPAGEILLAAVVHEENGGLGSRHLLKTLRPERCVIGEPSGNTLRRGHRGRFEFVLTFIGRSVHASVPHLGLNPHYSMSRFLLALAEVPMFFEPVFGGSTVAPTLSYVDQTSSNVIPASVTVHLDWRPAPGETYADARGILDGLIARTIDQGVDTAVSLRTHALRTYTGYEEDVLHDLPSFCLELEDPQLIAAQHLLEKALARQVPVDVWAFGTDGGYLAAAGVTCLGFGPGDEHMAHVLDERLPIDELIEATAGYMALAYGLSGGSPR